ncbi:hypothetical protein PUR34_06420 [Streptomyces sp. JV185]|uniref:hypothetical protein n=1 Tax=Streptomyces sp. JV185 TaxID=858638 RepID=UPI002E75F6E3|nr:hypothetical protein [Streptomyces sp. JV185]MEE1767822.1 hypothetical protein [Streptomyces sp. JV185]
MLGTVHTPVPYPCEPIDARVGRLLDAVTSRPTYAKEDWLVVVTADHGHAPAGGHGGNTPLGGTFVIAQGKVTEVRHRHLAYHGELDPVHGLELIRPTGHRG